MKTQRILVAVDLDEPSKHALDVARRFTASLDAQVEVFHVWDTPVYLPTGLGVAGTEPMDRTRFEAQFEDSARTKLDALVEASGLEATKTVARGLPAETILEKMASADLTILGTHGRKGLKGLFLGSVAEQVVRSAPSPVLVVPHHAESEVPPKVVLVAADLSAPSNEAYAAASELAARFGATLHVLHVIERVPTLEASEILSSNFAGTPFETYYELVGRNATAAIEQLVGDRAHTKIDIRVGRPSTDIAAVAEEIHADLVVMGTRGRSGLAHFGSVAERTLRHAPCPVLVVH